MFGKGKRVRRVVDDTVYDTDQATFVVRLKVKEGHKEDLYRTNSGVWFTVSNASGRFAAQITPISSEVALGNLTRSALVEIVEQYFPGHLQMNPASDELPPMKRERLRGAESFATEYKKRLQKVAAGDPFDIGAAIAEVDACLERFKQKVEAKK